MRVKKSAKKINTLSMKTGPTNIPRLEISDEELYSISPIMDEINDNIKYNPVLTVGTSWIMKYINVLFPKTTTIVVVLNENNKITFNTTYLVDFLDKQTQIPLKFCILIGIIMKDSLGNMTDGHANAFVVDTNRKEISIFEPNGSIIIDKKVEQSGLNASISVEIGEKILYLVSEYTEIDYSYRGVEYCPYIGVQAQEAFATNIYDELYFEERNVGGYCMAWSCMFIHYHLLNPSLSNDDIYSLFSSRFTSVELSHRISKYAKAMMMFHEHNKVPNTHFRRIISKKDFKDVVVECQKFIREYFKNVKDIDYFSGKMNLDDDALLERFYEKCGIREIVIKQIHYYSSGMFSNIYSLSTGELLKLYRMRLQELHTNIKKKYHQV